MTRIDSRYGLYLPSGQNSRPGQAREAGLEAR